MSLIKLNIEMASARSVFQKPIRRTRKEGDGGGGNERNLILCNAVLRLPTSVDGLSLRRSLTFRRRFTVGIYDATPAIESICRIQFLRLSLSCKFVCQTTAGRNGDKSILRCAARAIFSLIRIRSQSAGQDREKFISNENLLHSLNGFFSGSGSVPRALDGLLLRLAGN